MITTQNEADAKSLGERLSQLKLLKSELQLTVKEITEDIDRVERQLGTQVRNANVIAKKNRMRLALKLRAGGKTFKEVGAELGVSAERATQIVEQATRWNEMRRL